MKNSRPGLVVHKWAPQVDILSHKYVSASLSHCGWKSVLESLSQGVPIIGWPKASKQFYNAKFLEEEIGVCVEVAGGKSCVIIKNSIKYEQNFKGSSTKAMDDFFNAALTMREKIMVEFLTS
ncbi:hypothetical protein Q3G72_008198 [Acer saccharum]|nr:hypothetical protein Q3G72_008198 [Acer saccharum]